MASSQQTFRTVNSETYFHNPQIHGDDFQIKMSQQRKSFDL